jgi:phage pi2 protein 07
MNYAKKDEYLRSPKTQKILDVKECGHEFRPRDAFLKQKWIFHSKPLLFSVLYYIFVEILQKRGPNANKNRIKELFLHKRPHLH